MKGPPADHLFKCYVHIFNEDILLQGATLRILHSYIMTKDEKYWHVDDNGHITVTGCWLSHFGADDVIASVTEAPDRKTTGFTDRKTTGFTDRKTTGFTDRKTTGFTLTEAENYHSFRLLANHKFVVFYKCRTHAAQITANSPHRATTVVIDVVAPNGLFGLFGDSKIYSGTISLRIAEMLIMYATFCGGLAMRINIQIKV